MEEGLAQKIVAGSKDSFHEMGEGLTQKIRFTQCRKGQGMIVAGSKDSSQDRGWLKRFVSRAM